MLESIFRVLGFLFGAGFYAITMYILWIENKLRKQLSAKFVATAGIREFIRYGFGRLHTIDGYSLYKFLGIDKPFCDWVWSKKLKNNSNIKHDLPIEMEFGLVKNEHSIKSWTVRIFINYNYYRYQKLLFLLIMLDAAYLVAATIPRI